MSKARERVLAFALLLAAGAVPAYLYRQLLSDLVAGFQLELGYFVTGLSGFVLMALGLLTSLPVVLSIGRNPESRLYPRSRTALAGWGVSLYLLGVILLIQIGAIAGGY